jgi:hypothetical protein
MDEEMKTLAKQYIDARRKQRNDLMKELELSEAEADQAVSTLELYYHIEASEEQWAQAWKAAKRDFLAEYVDIARLGGGPGSRWT